MNFSRTLLLLLVDTEPERYQEISEDYLKFAAAKLGDGKNSELHELYEWVLKYEAVRNECRARVEGLEIKSLWADESKRRITSILDIHPQVLAEQLTLVEADYHNSIRLSEIMDLKWQKHPDDAPNMLRASARFNRFSRIVSTQILSNESPKMQAKIIGHFLSTALALVKLRNYSTAVQILSGINCIPVQRLKKFPEHLTYKHLLALEELTVTFDPTGSYKAYRELSHDYPTIPFHAVFLRDLTFAVEGNDLYQDEKKHVVNFQRMVMTGDILTNVWVRLPLEYPHLTRDEAICDFLHCLPALSENHMYKRSHALQPPKNQKLLDESSQTEDEQEREKANPLYGMHPGIVHLLVAKCCKERSVQHDPKTFHVKVASSEAASSFLSLDKRPELDEDPNDARTDNMSFVDDAFAGDADALDFGDPDDLVDFAMEDSPEASEDKSHASSIGAMEDDCV